MKTPFDTTQLQKFRETLEKKLKALIHMEQEHETEALHRPSELPNDRIMAADWSSETSTMAVNLKLADQEIAEAQEIESALTRLTLGVYGFCEECDSQIPVKRLEVQPEARTCIACETELEAIDTRVDHAIPEFRLEDPTM